MIELKDFQNYIDKVPTTDWYILFGIIPKIESCEVFRKWEKMEIMRFNCALVDI